MNAFFSAVSIRSFLLQSARVPSNNVSASMHLCIRTDSAEIVCGWVLATPVLPILFMHAAKTRGLEKRIDLSNVSLLEESRYSIPNEAELITMHQQLPVTKYSRCNSVRKKAICHGRSDFGVQLHTERADASDRIGTVV